jgi:hypothetical protein
VGLDKMLVDAVGEVTITNDGATILKVRRYSFIVFLLFTVEVGEYKCRGLRKINANEFVCACAVFFFFVFFACVFTIECKIDVGR